MTPEEEIAALRAETSQQEMRAVRAEAELAKLKQDETCEEYYRDLRDRERDLIAENERLRAALEAIGKGQWNTQRFNKTGRRFADVNQFARAALGGEEGK